METNYACDIFQSCEQESFIAQADITSSLAFMDFLGVNGENQSLSIITFSFSNDTTTSLTGEAYSCAMEVPEDGFVNGYPGNYQCACSYCAEVCQAPAVNANIAFFDGFSFKAVGWSYFAFITFTIAFQLLSHYACRRKPPTSISRDLIDSNATGDQSTYTNTGRRNNLNATVETSMENSRDMDGNSLLTGGMARQ